MGSTFRSVGVVCSSLGTFLVGATALAQEPSPAGAPAAGSAPSSVSAPAAAPATPDTPAPTEQVKSEPTYRFGPMAGIGLSARPVSLEGVFKYKKRIAAGAAYNFLPGFSIGAASVSAYQLEGNVRFMPAGGAFFLGAGVGYQSLQATAGQAGTPAFAAVDVHSMYVTPRLGWLWVTDSGFSIGLDLGAAIPFGVSTSVTPVGASSKDAVDAGNLIGSTVLPDVKLRLGWMFGAG